MKNIIKFVTVFLFAFFSVSAMAQVADCKHDVAPYDIGRYARDVKAGKNIQLSKVPVRTVWDTNMKGGKWVTCRTTQERTIALLEDGTYYDIGCGNEIKIAMPPTPLQSQVAQSPSFLTTSSPLVCKGVEECKQVKWCDDNSGWYASKDDKGNHVRRCDIPGEVSVISKENTIHVQEHTTVIPVQLPTTVKPWQVAAPVTVPPAPAVDIDLGRAAAPKVSGTKCSFDCVARATATDVVGFQNIPSTEKQCEIRWKATFGGEQGRILLDNFAGKIRLASVIPNASHPAVVVVSPWAHVRDCNVDQEMVKKNWDLVVQKLKLPECKPVDQAKKP